MLIYIRKERVDEVLSCEEEIPSHIIEKFVSEDNLMKKIYAEYQKTMSKGSCYLVSPETIALYMD